MRENTPKWRIDPSYDVEQGKIAQEFLDSNFGSKFQISQPAWYPDRAIKILHMEIFFFFFFWVVFNVWLIENI